MVYWGIPPEVNAFRLTMAGAGPTAHTAQVAALETAAMTHVQAATQMSATAAAVAPSFVGTGGTAMMAAALPQAAWLGVAGAHAQAGATTVLAGIEAYGTAVAATIPVPTVVANRVRVAALHASNILGQNTPAIAETDAEYGEFWAQNAGSMMGYLSAITGLLSALSVPLPIMPGMANPAMAAAAGAAAMGMSLGLQGASLAAGGAMQAGIGAAAGAMGAATAGLTAGVQSAGLATGAGQGVGSSAGSSSGTASTGGTTAALGAPTGGLASQAGQAGAQAGQSGAQGGQSGVSGASSAPGSAMPQMGQGPGDASQVMGSAQEMMGSVMSAPSMAAQSMGQVLSQAGQLPSSLAGQMSSMMSPAMSGLGSGGPTGLSMPVSSLATPLSGLSSGSGGFASGGSAVSAALTKPSAGGGMAGTAGVPAAWWSSNGAQAGQAPAGVRAGGGAPGAGLGGSGMYGMPAAMGAGRQKRATRDLADPDKNVLVDSGVGEGVPVYTDTGIVYVHGQEV